MWWWHRHHSLHQWRWGCKKQRILYCVEPWVHNYKWIPQNLTFRWPHVVINSYNKWIPQNLYRTKPVAHRHNKIPNILVMNLKQWLETSGDKPNGWIPKKSLKSYCRLFQQLTSKLHVWHGHCRRHCRNPGNHRRSPRVRHHHETNTKKDTTYQYLGWKAYLYAQYC